MKGASAGIHAEQLADVCSNLENQSAQLNTSALTAQLELLERLLARLTDELNMLVKADQSAA